MKKRILAALLIGSMVSMTALAGCGSSDTSSDTTAATADTSASAETSDATDTSAEAESEASGAYDVANVDEITLTLTTTYSETEYAGQLITKMIDELSEKSEGKVNIEVYWGGTLAESGEELSFVGSDAADMTIIGQSTYTDVLPLLNFPTQVLGGYEDAVSLMDTIAFEDAETAPMIEAEAIAQNVKFLGSTAAGSNAFVAKEAYTSLADMQGAKLGVGMQQSAFEAMGFNVVTVMPWDYYDNLSRGIADIGYMSTSALVSMSIQDVTPYFMSDGTYTAGNFITINLDKWNAMSADTQALFEEVVDDVQQYSIDLSYQLDEEAAATIEAAGGSLTQLPDSDCAEIQADLFNVGVDEARNYAETAGCSEDMETVLAKVAEITGNTLQ